MAGIPGIGGVSRSASGGFVNVLVERYENRFAEIIEYSEVEKEVILDETAEDIADSAAGYSRVDTGDMMRGWEWDELSPDTRSVYNEVEYTIYNEYGTVFMSAQPMLAPAIEDHTDDFIRRMAELYK
jgi:hypothetical protein